MSNSTYGIDGCWWGLRLKPEAYNAFPVGDLRGSYFFTTGQTVAVNNIADFTNGIAAPKFQNVTSLGATGSNPGFVDTDFPMFRLAEAYLIYAEAQVRGGGGDATTALTYVNALRVRAYGDSTGDHHGTPAHDSTSFWPSGSASCCGRATAAPTWSAMACSPAAATSGHGRAARRPGRRRMRITICIRFPRPSSWPTRT